MSLPESVIQALQVIKQHAKQEHDAAGLAELMVEINKLLSVMESQAARLEGKPRFN